MSDNTLLNVGTGGDLIATDDISGVKHQQVKVEFGVDGTATPVSSTNPLPVTLTPPTLVTFRTRFTAAQTDVALVTVSAGSRIMLTRLTVTLDNASTGFPSVLIGFGTASTPTSTAIFDHPGVPAGGGAQLGAGASAIAIGADNEDLRVTTVGAATGLGMAISGSYVVLTP